MRLKNLSTALFAVGLFVGGAASMGLLVGFEPARLPAALLNVAAYKLTFIASLSLIAAGAAVARYVRRAEAATRPGEVTSTPEQTPGQIGAAQNPDAFVQNIRHREPDRV